MTPQELSAAARSRVKAGATLLDVRTREEFAQHHIDGARNIPVQELAQRMAEVGPPTTPLVVHCHAGVRSKMAVQLLKQAGYTDILDLGSISAW